MIYTIKLNKDYHLFVEHLNYEKEEQQLLVELISSINGEYIETLYIRNSVINIPEIMEYIKGLKK